MINSRANFNFASIDNNAKVIDCSSHVPQCPPNNILNKQTRNLWLSKSDTPQYVTIDFRTITRYPKENHYNYWGIYIRYSSLFNPKRIELLSSFHNKEYKSLGVFEIKNKAGVQIFPLQHNGSNCSISYLKILVKEAYGRNTQCYFNKFFLFDLINSPINNIEEEMNKKILNEKDNKENSAIKENTLETLLKIKNVNEECTLRDRFKEEKNEKEIEIQKKMLHKSNDPFLTSKDIKNSQINKISSIIKNKHNDTNYNSKGCLYEEDKCGNNNINEDHYKRNDNFTQFRRINQNLYHTDNYLEKLNNQLNDLDSCLIQMKQNQSMSLKDRLKRVEKKVDNIEFDLYGRSVKYNNDSYYRNNNSNYNNSMRNSSTEPIKYSNSGLNIFKVNCNKNNTNDYFIDTLYNIVLKKDCDIIREKACHY